VKLSGVESKDELAAAETNELRLDFSSLFDDEQSQPCSEKLPPSAAATGQSNAASHLHSPSTSQNR